jgi:hypothetical protein
MVFFCAQRDCRKVMAVQITGIDQPRIVAPGIGIN